MDTIYHYMSEQLSTIEHDASVLSAAVKFREDSVHALVVTKNHDYIGVLTEVDIVGKVVAEGSNPKEITVSTIMKQPIIALDRNLPISVALQTMSKNNVRHILVTNQGKITGVLSIKDVARFYCERIKDPIVQFWSNYECLLDKAPFEYAIEKLLGEMVIHLGEESKAGRAIKDNKPRSEIAKIAKEEGLTDLAQILELQID